jgi:streptogramin lyase
LPVGSDPVPGSEIAGFRLEVLLGRGGMGAVYRATDVRLGRSVALKLLVPELAESDRFRERFLRESQLAAALDHPNIIPIYAAGDADGQLYLAMRYVEGSDLRQLIAREAPLDTPRALRLIEQVGDALDAAHERGLVHRDVKPGNVLIAGGSGREHCYLTDFGLTKQTSSISGLTGTGELVGTIEYVSPEQIRGDRIDGRSDVYSLGCVLYECLTAKRPFARDSEVATLWAHVHEPPPALGGEIDGVMARALAKAPDERYGTCSELVASARTALGLEERSTKARPRRRRHLHLGLPTLLAAAAAAAGVALIAGVLLLRGPDVLTGIEPRSVGVIDPASGELVRDIPLGFESSLMAAGEGFVWVLDQKARTLTTIDPETMEVSAPTGIPADGIPVGLAVGEGSVWVAVNQGRRLSVLQIGPELNELRRSITVHQSQFGTLSVLRETVVLTVGDGAVWALERGRGEVTRIDPTTGKPTRLTEGHAASLSIAVENRAIWLGGINGVTKLDASSGSELGSTFVTDVIDSTATSIAIGRDATWFTANSRARLWRIPPAGNTVDDSFEVGAGPNAVAVDEKGIVWVASGGDGSVSHLDPREDSAETIEIGSSPGGILAAFDLVWTSPGAPLRDG